MARHSAGAWYRAAQDSWYATILGRQVPLGIRGKANKRAAQEAWCRLVAGAERPPLTVACTFGQLADDFLADVADRAKPTTVEGYRYFLGVARTKFGHRRASDLTPGDIEAVARRPSWSSSTRHDFAAAVVTAFRWGVRTKRLDANPLVGIRLPSKTSRGARAVLTAEQSERLLAASPVPLRHLLRALWLTGARPGELTRLTAADVDFGTGMALLAEHKTAAVTGRPRIIFLPVAALALLRSLADANPSGLLFRNARGRPWTGWAIVKAVDTVRKRAGVPHATAYGFRHTFATDALASGVPDAHVAELLGHSGTAMLHKHYAHLGARARLLRNAAAKVRD